MPTLKRSSSCWIESPFENGPDIPPIKKAKSFSVFGNRFKNKWENFICSKTLFRNRSKIKGENQSESDFAIIEESQSKMEDDKETTNEMEVVRNSEVLSSPVSTFIRSLSYDDSKHNFSSSTFNSDGDDGIITFDSDFTKEVIGNSAPNERFRMEQEVLAKDIIGTESCISDLDISIDSISNNNPDTSLSCINTSSGESDSDSSEPITVLYTPKPENVESNSNIFSSSFVDSNFKINETKINMTKELTITKVKSILKQPSCSQDADISNSSCKSVRFKAGHEIFSIHNETSSSIKDVFNFDRLLDALNKFVDTVRFKDKDSDEPPLIVERDFSLKRRIIVAPKEPSSTLKFLKLKQFRKMFEANYKTKYTIKYLPRKLSKQQWKRVDLILFDSFNELAQENFKTKSGRLIDCEKSFPKIACAIEGDSFIKEMEKARQNVFVFSKNNINITQTFCDFVKNVIDRSKSNKATNRRRPSFSTRAFNTPTTTIARQSSTQKPTPKPIPTTKPQTTKSVQRNMVQNPTTQPPSSSTAKPTTARAPPTTESSTTKPPTTNPSTTETPTTNPPTTETPKTNPPPTTKASKPTKTTKKRTGRWVVRTVTKPKPTKKPGFTILTTSGPIITTKKKTTPKKSAQKKTTQKPKYIKKTNTPSKTSAAKPNKPTTRPTGRPGEPKRDYGDAYQDYN
uniref:ERCC4 domain-containing protein n=1 Tax=Parastrongyloides trichosuri TaxID=131310 RepID=A0A0N4Z8R8_PARTI